MNPAVHQSARKPRLPRRSSTPLLCLVAVCLIALGCNTDPRCRRETALMRAEILDIEDKYAVLKSKYDSAAIRLHELTGEPIDDTLYLDPTRYQQTVIESEGLAGEVFVDDGLLLSEPIIVEHAGQPIYQPGTVVTPGEVIISEQVFPGQIQPGQIQPGRANGFPAPQGGGAIVNPSPSALPQPPSRIDGPRGELPLPEATMTDDFKLNLTGQRRGGLRGSALTASASRLRTMATEIVINHEATRGHDVDGLPGDEGLNLMLQPKNSAGVTVLQAGDLSISLVDPKLNRRIGFWRFLPEEVELFFVNDEIASNGILLHLPWEESVPSRQRLIVQVEYVTADGRTLTSSGDVLIKPPGEDYSPNDPLVTQWTQRDTRWGVEDYAGGDDPKWQQRLQLDRNLLQQRKPNAANNGPAVSRRRTDSNQADQELPQQPKWRPVR